MTCRKNVDSLLFDFDFVIFNLTMSPNTESQQPNPDVFKEAGTKVETILERAEVRNVREQKLLEVTHDYIDRYQEVLYEHRADGTLKRDETGSPIEKNSRAVKETLLRSGDKDSAEYNPYTAFICAQILRERHQVSLEAKQSAHGRDLEQAIRTFQETKEESKVLFGHGKGRTKTPEPSDPRHPDLASIETAQKVYANNNERWRNGKSSLQKIEQVQKVGGYQIPDRQARAEIRTMIEYYNGKHTELNSEIVNLMSEAVQPNDPRYASHQAEIQKATAEQDEIRDFLTAANQPDIYRKYKAREWVTGAEKVDPTTGKMVLDTEHLDNLANIQQAAAEFVSRRQARVLGEQQNAWQVLSDDKISGLSDLEEIARTEEQYGKFERIWVKEMGGDTEEIRNRIEWWGGLKAAERTVKRELSTEMASLGALGEITSALLAAQTPEEIRATKDKMEVFSLVARKLGEMGLTEEQVRAALGIRLPEATVPTPVAPEVAPIVEIFKVEAGAASIASPEHPAKNEDSYFLNENLGIAGLFDGMGGHAAGEAASQIAKDTIFESLKKIPAAAGPQEIQNFLIQALIEANSKIIDEAKKDPKKKEMGTSASVAKIWTGPNGERKLIFANTADSRVYLHRKDGSIIQITQDNFPIPASSEEIDQATNLSKLSHDQHESFLNRNIVFGPLGSAAILTESVIHKGIIDLEEGDEVFLTSDGIHDNLTRERIREVFERNKGKPASELAKLLAEDAIAFSQMSTLARTEIYKGFPVDPETQRKIDEANKKIQDAFEFVSVKLSSAFTGNEADYAAAERAKDFLENLGLWGNPNINLAKLTEIIEQKMASDPKGIAEAEIRAGFREIFPAFERAKVDDITAVVLRPTVERITPPTAAPTAAGIEAGAVYVPPEAFTEITRLLAEAVRRASPKESFDEQQKRLIAELQNGGGWYNFLTDQLGETEAQIFGRRAMSVGASMKWSGFLGWFFAEILNLFTQH